MTVPQPTGQFSGSCSDLGTKCLSSPHLTLETWGIPGKLLICGLHRNPEEVDFMPAVTTVLMNMLARVAKAGQKESLLLGSPFTWAALEDGLPASNNLTKKPPRVPSCFWISQS